MRHDDEVEALSYKSRSKLPPVKHEIIGMCALSQVVANVGELFGICRIGDNNNVTYRARFTLNVELYARPDVDVFGRGRGNALVVFLVIEKVVVRDGSNTNLAVCQGLSKASRIDITPAIAALRLNGMTM